MARLDAVGLIVGDLARSIRFYRELGIEFPEGAEQSEHGHAEADLGGGFRLLVDTEDGIKSFDPGWVAAGRLAGQGVRPAGVDRRADR